MTIEVALTRHSNDFGFSPKDMVEWSPKALPSLSIIIPYFETGPVFRSTLGHLYHSISRVTGQYSGWQYEVLVLDDGSVRYPVKRQIRVEDWPNLMTITSTTNNGRTLTRNQGLLRARYEKCLFIDSDIAADTTSVRHSLVLAEASTKKAGREAIVVSFFESRQTLPTANTLIQATSLEIDDFRLSCRYKSSWIGCKKDELFVSEDFAPVRDTNFFRLWTGSVGPWLLPNMVLGGFFLIDRHSALNANGFDAMFQEYGFTETTLPTKLIAAFKHFVIPQVVGGAIHAKQTPSHLTQKERNSYFRKAHKKYFEEYLRFSVGHALGRPIRGWSS